MYDWRVASTPVCDLRHVHYNALTISYEHNFQRKTCKKMQLFKGKVPKRSMMVPSGHDSTQIKFLPWPWCRITAHTSRADGHPKCTLAVKVEFSFSVNERKVHSTLFPPRWPHSMDETSFSIFKCLCISFSSFSRQNSGLIITKWAA